MTSPIAKTGAATASTNTQQPTNAAQASGLASLITATAAPAFTALGSPHASSPLSGGSPSALRLQADVKVASEIDTLVELGKTGGTIHASMDEIRATISQKIQDLRESAKDPYKLASVRSDLCKLSGISSTHYPDLKEEVFNLLIHLMESDPIAPHTAEGILGIVFDLNNALAVMDVQMLTIRFQKKLVRAFSAAVELYLRHYSMKHVNAIMQERKKGLLDTADSFTKLNRQDDSDIVYATQMAMQASRRFTSDLTAFREFFKRFIHCATAVGNAYNKDVSGFFSEMIEAFQGLEHKFKGEWFEALFMLRNQVQKAPDKMKKVIAIQTLLATKKTSYDWKFIYGALDNLGEVISQTQDVKVLSAALFGHSPTEIDMTAVPSMGMRKETASLGAAAARSVVPKYPGAVEFLQFNNFTTEAKIATKEDKKADSAIQSKAKELCTLLIRKLYVTSEGAKRITDYCLPLSLSKNAQNHPLLAIVKANTPQSSTTKLFQHISKATLISTHFSSMSIKINENSLLPQKQQNDKEKDIKQTASTAVVEAAITKEEPMSDFHKAVIKGDFANVQKTISHNKELVNSKDFKGNTTLILAASKGHLKICEILMEAGASPVTRGANFRNALHSAAAAGNIEIVKLFASDKTLLSALDDNNKTPLVLAAEQGHATICGVLLERQADGVDQKGPKALHITAAKGNIAIANLLIKHIGTVNKTQLDDKDEAGNTALLLATQNGHHQVCEALLKAGANPAVNDLLGNNALHTAVEKGNIRVVQLLSAYKGLLDSKSHQGSVPLILAAMEGYSEICETLLAAGANPSATDEDGRNCVHAAVKAGSVVIIRLLLVHKQLLDAKDKLGWTPLLYAAGAGNEEVFELLLKSGANPLTTISEDGFSVMHSAAGFGKTKIIKTLLVHKQLIDAKAKEGGTPFMFAVLRGNLEACEILIKAGANPLATDEEGRNAMHFAAREGKVQIVSMLLVHKQLLDAKDKKECTPLLLAAQKGHLEVCELLLKAGANPLSTNEDGWSAMHKAAGNRKAAIVRLLLVHKELINAKGKDGGESHDGATPLMIAAINGDLEICELLLKAGADPMARNKMGFNAMHWAAGNGEIAIVQLLSAHKELIDSKSKSGHTPLTLASQQRRSAVCELLLKVGANPLATDEDGRNAMHWAAAIGLTEIVRFLLVYKQLIDSKSKKDEIPLLLASEKGSIEVCELLLKAGANPLATDEDGLNAMHCAAKNGKREIVRMLLIYKQLISSKTSAGFTPLMFAALSGDLEMCELLLKAEANPLATDEDGFNAMHYAAEIGKTEIVRILAAHKQLIDSKTGAGNTPLILASQYGHLEAYELLLKAGANPLAANENGRTAMHYAAQEGKTAIVRMLAVHKQLIEAKDKEGVTPLMCTAETGFLEVCELLFKEGANPLATNESGWNPMHYAAYYKKTGIVQFLSAHIQLIDSKIKTGHTSLMLAAQEGHKEVCEALLKTGANPLATEENGWNAMHLAANKGKTEIVQFLSAHKQLIDSKTKTGRTSLMLAAQEGHKEVCELLLKEGANPLATGENGWNAMHWAAYKGKTEIVQFLSVHKQLIDSKIKTGNTSLMLSAQEGLKEVCEALLKAGANPLATGENGWNAMHWAAYKGKTEIVQFLSVHKQLIDSKIKAGNTSLMLAAQEGHKEVCELLLKEGANPLATQENGWNAMHWAANKGKTEIVQFLSVDKQLMNSKTKKGNSSLTLAAQEGHLDTCEVLLKAGADPVATDEKEKNAMLLLAAKGGHYQACQVLLKAGADYTVKDLLGRNALHLAVEKGNKPTVQLFVGFNKLIDSVSNEGKTPLIIATELRHFEICALLLSIGANPSLVDLKHRNAMHAAAQAGCAEVIRLLTRHKQLIDTKDEDGHTPLTLAAYHGHPEAFEALIQAGADPKVTDEDGQNAMHLAAGLGKTAIVQLLLAHKELIDSKSKSGHTPLTLAAQQSRSAVCELLLKVGANPLATDENGRNAMHWAAGLGKTEIIRLFSAYKQLIDSKSKKGEIPLLLAVGQGSSAACELLLNAGASPLITDENGWNAMHYSAGNGKSEIVRLLSAHKQLLNSKIKSGHTPLMLAAQRGHLEVCKVLLEAGADPKATYEDGKTAMQLAELAGETEVVKVLSEHMKQSDAKK